MIRMDSRTADETIASILHAAIGGVTKTTIMYKSFITYDQLNEYLSLLVEKGLISYQEGEKLYRTTDKGINFVQANKKPNGFNKILIVGLGQLGLPVAKYVKEKGFDDVYGYDISPKAIDRAEKTAGIKKATDFSDFDVYIVCVSTHKPEDMFSPYIEGLLSVVDRISKEAKRDGALVSIESTIPRGTSNKVLEILGHRLHVAHAPHRWYALEEKEHGVNQLRVVGGVHDCCLEAAMQFYNGGGGVEGEGYSNSGSNNSRMVGSSIIDVGSSNNNHDGEENNSNSNNNTVINPNITPTNTTTTTTTITTATKSLGIPMHPVSKIEIAEVTKIIENAHRYLQIAFAEDLYLYCQANNINFSELRDALNTKWNVNILEPREGVGGHCLPKDTKMFLQSSKTIKSKILTAAVEVDQDYRRYRQTRVVNRKSILSPSLSSSSPPSSNFAEDYTQLKNNNNND
jgi:UDP-N-acetyl-D-mannosaminuronic acid dehydrogenase